MSSRPLPQVRPPSSRQEWDGLVERMSGQVLQSWAWGEFKSLFGWKPLRLIAGAGDEASAAQVLFRSLPGQLWTTAYVPKGPLLDPTRPSSSAEGLLSGLHAACRQRRAIFLKVEPHWQDEARTHAWLQAHGFAASPQTVQPRRTVLVDLTADEQAILAQMKPKTRYNVRLAQRRGVSVQQGSVRDLQAFYRLLQITGRRDGFGIHTEAYYTQAYQLLAAQGAAALFEAQYEGSVLGALMVVAWGKHAWYMYGASSDEERARMPNHVLQWEAMRWAKARGCEAYDLWGIPDVDENAIGPDIAQAEEGGALSTGLGGLYRFKRGFGGREVRYVGAYDFVYNRPLYFLLTTLWDRRRHQAGL
jgi:peptidoglycan pentaglycine glycine transferase (the first glycine)